MANSHVKCAQLTALVIREMHNEIQPPTTVMAKMETY